MTEPTAREKFTTALLTAPLLQSDAIVVLCGEDCVPRLETAAQLMRNGGAPRIVVSGGRNGTPRLMDANAAFDWLLAQGVEYDRLVLENESQNTFEQADKVTWIAATKGWKSMLLVASAYHLPRAYLTFVRQFVVGDLAADWRLTGVPCSQSGWSTSPQGMTETRMELLATEYEKIERYRALGHVASYEAGLSHLQSWEGKP